MNNISIEDYIIRASEYESQGDYEKMFSMIAQGLKADPYNYELYYQLGFCCCYLGNVNQAYLALENAAFYCERQALRGDRESENDLQELVAAMEKMKSSEHFCVRKTAIIVVTYNLLEYQKVNILSIRSYAKKGTYEIIAVDNASTDGCYEWLKDQPDVKLIRNEENKGFPIACNQGAELAKDKDILLLNNDTMLTPNALFWLRMALYSDDNVGAAGAYSNKAGNMQNIEVDFAELEDYLEYGEKNNVPMEKPVDERTRLSGFGMLIRSGLWERVGGMDERFSPGYFEDDDLSMKIRSLGYRLLACKNSFIYHEGSTSFSKVNNTNDIIYNHYLLFNQKYGFNIIDVAYPNMKFLSGIPFSADEEFNVLVIGYCLGAEAIYISENYSKAKVVAVEKRKEFLKVFNNRHILYSDIYKLKEDFDVSVFDLVIINNVGSDVYTEEELGIIKQMCSKECVVIK